MMVRCLLTFLVIVSTSFSQSQVKAFVIEEDHRSQIWLHGKSLECLNLKSHQSKNELSKDKIKKDCKIDHLTIVEKERITMTQVSDIGFVKESSQYNCGYPKPRLEVFLKTKLRELPVFLGNHFRLLKKNEPELKKIKEWAQSNKKKIRSKGYFLELHNIVKNIKTNEIYIIGISMDMATSFALFSYSKKENKANFLKYISAHPCGS